MNKLPALCAQYFLLTLLCKLYLQRDYFVIPKVGALNQFIACSLSLTEHFYFVVFAQTPFGNTPNKNARHSPGSKLICGEGGIRTRGTV